MRRSRFLSLNITLGLSGEVALSRDRKTFHTKVVQLVYPRKKNLHRIGLSHTSAFDNLTMRLDAAYVSNLINAAIIEALTNAKSFDVLLIDFSNNAFDLLRDPILMQLANVFAQLSGTGICSTFILLLPRLPANELASIQHFNATAQRQPHSRLVVIGNNGDSLWLPKSGKVSSLKPRYTKLLQSLEVEVAERFKSKIVKRMGHFVRARHEGGCRLYSYTADNCDKELLQLLKNWWAQTKPKPNAILYDSSSNESLIQAIIALCTSKMMQFYRVQDVFTIPEEARKAAEHPVATLVVDVVETGATLVKQITKLKEMNINLGREIVAAIAKGSNRQKLGEFKISSFASTEAEPYSESCVQCQLGLPHMSDLIESFDALRSFDFWYMAHEVGWEPESDVPVTVGEGYKMVPKFTEMLMNHGDWIAYKMEMLCKTLTYPENIFVIHPEEDGARAVSQNLRLRFDGKLNVVEIPRPAIEKAQAINNSWEPIIAKLGSRVRWIEELKTLTNASALITDIFNASGSTFRSLSALLKLFHIQIFCYFPFVDRDFGAENSYKYDVTKYSLYRWYGPRRLRQK